MIGNAIHNAKNVSAATRPITFQAPSGGSLPINVKIIKSTTINQNQYLKSPLLLAGATFGLLSKNGSAKKITCAIANATKPRSLEWS